MHAVEVAATARRLFTGGEDGRVGIFDLRANAVQHLLDTTNGSSGENGAGGAWVSSLNCDDDGNWLTVGGGVEWRSPSSSSAAAASPTTTASTGGHLSLFNVPTRAVMARAETPSPIHALAKSADDGTLLSVGGDGAVTYWDGGLGTNFTPRGRASLSVPCSYSVLSANQSAMAAHGDGKRIGEGVDDSGDAVMTTTDFNERGRDTDEAADGAVLFVGGSGPIIDVFTNPSAASASLCLV